MSLADRGAVGAAHRTADLIGRQMAACRGPAEARGRLDGALYAGQRLLVPTVQRDGVAVPHVAGGMHVMPVFTDQEALEAWLAPVPGMPPPDPAWGPVPDGALPVAVPDELLELVARSGGDCAVSCNPAGPGHVTLSLPGTPAPAGGGSGRLLGPSAAPDPMADVSQRAATRSRITAALEDGARLRERGDAVATVAALWRVRDPYAAIFDDLRLSAALYLISQEHLRAGAMDQALSTALAAARGCTTLARAQWEYQGWEQVAAVALRLGPGAARMAREQVMELVVGLTDVADAARAQGFLPEDRHAAVHQRAREVYESLLGGVARP